LSNTKKQTVHSFSTQFNGLANVLVIDAHIQSAIDPQPFKTYKAIRDTGATNCVITDKVINECSLKPVGIRQVHGVHGKDMSPVYIVNIGLPNGVGFMSSHVTRGVLTEGLDMLIGMDIINKGDFALTHNDGKTLLSYRNPSVGKIDFVNQKAGGLDISRKSPCPCGSGKKYKRCCGKHT